MPCNYSPFLNACVYHVPAYVHEHMCVGAIAHVCTCVMVRGQPLVPSTGTPTIS